jgi:hypothetical protein
VTEQQELQFYPIHVGSSRQNIASIVRNAYAVPRINSHFAEKYEKISTLLQHKTLISPIEFRIRERFAFDAAKINKPTAAANLSFSRIAAVFHFRVSAGTGTGDAEDVRHFPCLRRFTPFCLLFFRHVRTFRRLQRKFISFVGCVTVIIHRRLGDRRAMI